jgi:hypothetical protein
MKWIKKGLILKPSGQFDWLFTHASIPFAEHVRQDIFRIYFYGRDTLNRSRPGYIEIDINHPQKILYITKKPILELGSTGSFDESGVMPSWVINHNGMRYLYYTGWTRGVTVTHYFYVGLAISDANGTTFRRVSEAPVLERNIFDPYLTASPCILIKNKLWRMWYVSSAKRTIENGLPKPYEQIKYAESLDGITWNRQGIVCLDFRSINECALTRPCVYIEKGIYKMWYSIYKDSTYRIGYADSSDGIVWQRKDNEAGIDVSESGWDSEMIEYAFVFAHNGRKYMLYNGNEYGRTGLGYAISE